ncbi:uncharacterized protein [Euphorbia lathyris]|uniref:uncharacterized protein n=1 Tax=Euphorbia lathyris TaxID=212925 RepID=UPI0033135A7A
MEEKKIIDYTLIPAGFGIMIAYHIWLFLRVIYTPYKTVIGVNAVNRRFWVRAMMQDPSKNGVLSVQTLRNNIMASTLLASTAITLSSVIAVLMGNATKDRRAWMFAYGDTSEMGLSVRFFCLMLCFLVAFLLNVQSIRYYNHASILINVPFNKISPDHHLTAATAEYVAKSVNWGSYFWSLGLRAFYFSLPLFLWIFGPIPMFICCVLLVLSLYFLDVASQCDWVVGFDDDDDDDDHRNDQ